MDQIQFSGNLSILFAFEINLSIQRNTLKHISLVGMSKLSVKPNEPIESTEFESSIRLI